MDKARSSEWNPGRMAADLDIEIGKKIFPVFGISFSRPAKHTLRMATHALVCMPEHTKEQNENRNTVGTAMPAITITTVPELCK